MHLRCPFPALIALALATGALLGPYTEVVAQGGVQLKGRIDLNLTTESGRATRMTGANTSYWNLSGREPLGRVEALFALESAFDPDTGAGSRRLWGRESWVGLGHRDARLRLGRSRSPLQLSATAFNPHGTDSVGSLGTTALLLGHGSLGRIDDAIYADTAGPGGVSLNLAWALRDEALAQGSPPWRALRVRWQHGGWDLAAGHARAGDPDRVHSLAGAWSHGGFKVMALWNQGERAGTPRRARLVGLEAPFAGLGWRLSWSEAGRTEPVAVERRLWAIGADHNLSPRTQIYATAAWQRREDQSRGRATELGLLHRF
jgi:predicted porin